ncbi:penicillin-binding transpeptidase domain-containing protein [Streptacidiphilus sp. EB129]|uniref:penicillin-binding transpeptidase domain-containing protein n=1 Tax=Streptacidiphilus sp. EB129 TaxID=3156262 RepID=UPI003513BAD9
MRRGVKIGVVSGTCAVLLATGGYGAYNLVHAVTGSTTGDSAAAADQAVQSPTPPSAAEALKRAQDFLGAWQAGPAHYPGAASDTNSPDTAQTALTGYHDGLQLGSMTFGGVAAAGPDPAQSAATRVAFTVTAQVKGGTWSYPGQLDVIQSKAGNTSVSWASSVLYPALKDGQSLTAGAISAQAAGVDVVAKDGRTKLSAFPSLTDIAATIGQHGAGSATGSGSSTGTGGTGVQIVDASNVPVQTVKVFTAAQGAAITTTIDPVLQARAESAVRNAVLNGLPASTVVLDWRTGHILALAYANTGGDGNTAMLGQLAPGSTMKIITAAALFDQAGLTPSSAAPCPATIAAANSVFKNDFADPHPGDTVTTAFARSCNTAFIKLGFDKLVQHNSDTHQLGQEATDVFGLNGSWSVGGGVATTDAKVPTNTDPATAAADLIGQGSVTMNPLALASIAATVRDSAFRQPVILPGQPQVVAGQQISAGTARELRTLMSAAAHDAEGTATPRLGGYGDAGAKTGTSEVGQSSITTNGWFTAYNDHIAVAALVQGGSSGVGSAGYVAAALITATE